MRGIKRACKHCKARFIPKRSDAEFCSNLCRQAAYFRRDRKRREIAVNAIRSKRQKDALAIIDQFDRYQSLAGNLHVIADERGYNFRFMPTRIGILALESGPATQEAIRWLDRHFCRWRRQEASIGDREIIALLGDTRVLGPYIAQEADREFRNSLQEAPAANISVFVEDEENTLPKYRNETRFPTISVDEVRIAPQLSGRIEPLPGDFANVQPLDSLLDEGEFDPRAEPVTADDLPENAGVMDYADPFWR